MGKRFGYARVSTNGQTADLQRDALDKAGCDRLFVDVASGAKAHRPELDRMMELLREGDVVVVWRLDRLGRSVQNLVELMNRFQQMGVGFVSLNEAIDTTTPGGILVFNIFAALAQFERDLIRERTNAGLEAARARGRKGGRPTKLDGRQVREIRRLYESRTVTVNQIAAMMGVGRATIYRALERGDVSDARRSASVGTSRA
ncbi:recombinase family protein [Bifidobacterium sp. SO4]|uniref:recombinase family protein n=1 Tax=Bifidobacterium sp. SO4 TaxID=2809030 RepID=UPI001BDD4D99|nr:recombinase family protein [Bifidobacterium sp. SO4]MBT1171211.1 recombinase family protein [Bifidobacterium sp. SO4]